MDPWEVSTLTPKLVTFDCANTLIWTDWQPHTFALRCAEMAGLDLPENAGTLYMKLFLPKLGEFWTINQSRSLDKWRHFWVRQVSDWLTAMQLPTDHALELHLIGEQEIFQVPSSTFRRFDDAIPCLTRLKNKGIRLAILSNWDTSIHKCVEAQGLTSYFDAVYASLEEGVEKPDPRFFEIALKRFGFTAEQTFHIGDDEIDDLRGAQDMGIPCALLDRLSPGISRPVINSLSQIEEAFAWYD
jgi:HAD superfamily hydrolase (TIGR01549 family)